jgi:hypothetical protein
MDIQQIQQRMIIQYVYIIIIIFYYYIYIYIYNQSNQVQ